MPERKIEFIGKGFKIHSVSGHDPIIIEAEYVGPVACPDCNSKQLRTKDRIQRMIRHESFGRRKSWINLVVRKYHCLSCHRYFRARVPGILPYKRSTEYFRRESVLTIATAYPKPRFVVTAGLEPPQLSAGSTIILIRTESYPSENPRHFLGYDYPLSLTD